VVQSPSFIEYTSCFRTDRGHHQQGLESPSDLTLLREEEASGKHCTPGIAVPMVIADQTCRQWHERILDPCGSFSLRADMFDE